MQAEDWVERQVRQAQELPQRLAKIRTEREVRAIVEDINKRIREVHRNPQAGPPLRLGPLDVDEVIRDWRA